MQVVSGPGRTPLMLARVAAFVAVGVVGGLALSTIPNVELVTAICFAAGYLLGAWAGLLTGALVELIFAGFHPMGSSMGFLLLSQMLGMAGAGLTGALSRRICGPATGRCYLLVLVSSALISTVWFDVLTNLAYPASVGFVGMDPRVYAAAALPFAAIHIVSNLAVFLVIVAPLMPRLRKALNW